MFSRTQFRQALTWREQLAELETYQKDFAANEGIMTLYERQNYNAEYESVKKRFEPSIQAGAIGEYRSALAQFRLAQAREKAAKKNEINRWDPAKLAANMQVVDILINQSIAAGKYQDDLPGAVAAIYEEAKESGDPVKLRAACEVLRSITARGTDQDERMRLNRIAGDARRDLEGLRQTEEMTQANEAASKAFDTLQDHYRELAQVQQALTGHEPALHFCSTEFEREMAKVVIDHKTGEVHTFEDWREGQDFAFSIKDKNSNAY